MGMIQIQISDDVKAALERAYPGETVEAAVQRIVEAAAVRTEIKSDRSETLVQMARRIREGSMPTSDDEIRALRQEGRP
jgi:hypothetical protein